MRYRQDENGISDQNAVEAWAKLAPYLSRAGVETGGMAPDSPVAVVMEVRQWGRVQRRSVLDERWEALRQSLALARDLQEADLMRAVLEEGDVLPEEQRRLLRAEAGVGLVRLGHFADARPLLQEIVDVDYEVQRPDAHVYLAQSLYRPENATREDLDNAERVLKTVLVRRAGHPEVRALGTVLALVYDDAPAGDAARELLPAVRVAARLASERRDERFWALASLAECVLHEQFLGGAPDAVGLRAAYREAGREHAPEGFLDSTLSQLQFLAHLGLPDGPLAEARAGLLEGAARQP